MLTPHFINQNQEFLVCGRGSDYLPFGKILGHRSFFYT